ncbi:hypothetical protein F4604DRAFT_1681250 [Suillus subluteus]|nr:hypothetical protein F4604DRAFT_1681250 [Suillus subluteus]
MSQDDGVPPHHSGQSWTQPETTQTMSPQDSEDPMKSFDWMHSVFESSALDIQKAFDFDNLVTISDQVPYPTIDDIQYSRLFSPQAAEQGEGRSQSAAPCDPSPSPVLDVLPPALAPAAPMPAQTAPLIVFGLADLNKVKVAALFQMKCSIFSTSFLPNDDLVIKTMATNCLNAQVCHSAELSAWAKTKCGQEEITKLCSALLMIRKNIQFLARSNVLWGYNLHQLLDTEEKEVLSFEVSSRDSLLLLLQVNGEDINIPFGNLALWYYI